MSVRASSREIEQTAAEWLARCDAGTCTGAERAALKDWLAQDSAHKVAYLRLQTAWSEAGRLRVLAAGRPQDASAHAVPTHHRDRRAQMLEALQPRARPRHIPRTRWFHVAAAAALAACALLLGWSLRPDPPVAASVYASTLGQVRSFALADGSRATLSSDSRIEVRLLPHARDITLVRGEAIFEVAKDPTRPFTVAAAGYRAIAVGTRYGVRQDASNLRVVVTEGTVRLESPASGQPARPAVLLPAGSLALVQGGNVLVRSLAVAQARELLDWPSGMLAFHDAPLSEVVAEFNRFNARKLVLADGAAAALRVGGNFRWDNEEGFVRLLEAGFPVRAEAGDDRIVLHSR